MFDELKTPCFIVNKSIVEKNLGDFDKALSAKFSRHIIGYSFKTNSLPALIKIVKENGCYAETVSDTEYELAKKIGFESNHIIFNGPIKGHDLFIQSIKEESIVNIDSKREIGWLTELSNQKKDINIGLRVNFDIEKYLPGNSSGGKEGTRFGFCYENGELKNVIDKCKEQKNIKIAGLHMHISSKTKSKEVYDLLAKEAVKIVQEFDLDLDYIDIGGGFFGGNDEGEAYKSYVDTIFNELQQYHMEKIDIIVEPGASIIATAVEYLTKVLETKDTTYHRFVLTDGTRLHIDPFIRKSSYVYDLILKNQLREINEQVICGYTCMENDRFMKVRDESELTSGDYIKYDITGSYTMCFNSLFIQYLPNVYLKDKNGYRLIRKRWSVEQAIQNCDY